MAYRKHLIMSKGMKEEKRSILHVPVHLFSYETELNKFQTNSRGSKKTGTYEHFSELIHIIIAREKNSTTFTTCVSKLLLFAYSSNNYLNCFEFLVSLTFTFLSEPHTINEKTNSYHPFCCKNILYLHIK